MTIKTAVLFALCLFTVPVEAEWRAIGRGYYLNYNAGRHNGYYYRKACATGCASCANYYPSAACSYVVHSVVPQAQPEVVQYSRNWKSDLLAAVEKQRDTELFVRALRESGLQPTQQYAQQAAYNNTVKGTTTIASGYIPYAQQGNTLYGLQAYAPSVATIDYQAAMQQQSRLVEQALTMADNVQLGMSQNINDVGKWQAEIAKIQEAGKATAEIIRASQTPTTTTTHFETQAGNNSIGSSAAAAQQAQGGRGQPPAPPTETATIQGQKSYAMALVRAQNIIDQKCALCHSDSGIQEAKLSLSKFSIWGNDRYDAYAEKMYKRLTSDDPEFMMPPPDSKAGELTEAERQSLLSVLK